MRLTRLAAAAVTLTAALSMTGPAWASEASTSKLAGCSDVKNGWSNGNVFAFNQPNCGGTMLGYTRGNDPDWNAAGGGFVNDANQAVSVLNDGGTDPNGLTVVAFYDKINYDYRYGYRCLDMGDWVPDLSGLVYYRADNLPAALVKNTISSHQWVTRSACAGPSWMG
ncbi:hypothetical protein SAMN05216275_102349 [Streptosporangium canum]|uniref:Peptidase inhibitor family I36 n=1 Tax=Streptosporangium canum TaxID=324952 RepID=A0A1I3H4I9_9ACTN|nr:hypothetical protein [Streptosporangium canum]SFI30579.1 hypothetical protein SAMN05216275_102349 [Streptosporangium canum]